MNINTPLETDEWQLLVKQQRKLKRQSLRKLFHGDPERGRRFSLQTQGIYFDYSKNLLNDETIRLLVRLAETMGLPRAREQLFSGERINVSEDRPALHTALRNMNQEPVLVDGQNIMPEIFALLLKLKNISESIRSGHFRGFSGKPIKRVINIGIGGSDLGPRLAVAALKPYADSDLTISFVANVDGASISDALAAANPEETLFIISSKSFSTAETIKNALTAKRWITGRFQKEAATGNHFLAVTANRREALSFGVLPENILQLWQWVGGRFSLTSAVGLPLILAVGFDRFQEMLQGFHDLDNHFRQAPLAENIPVLMALLGIWYNNFFANPMHVVLPYCENLSLLPAYLQQLEMESNGKGSSRTGDPIKYHTAPVIWGGVGTNGQHAFFQLLHQGTRWIPCDFIGFINPHHTLRAHHDNLLANLLAQSKSLAFGKTARELEKEGDDPAGIPFRVFEGSRPSNTILLPELSPGGLGKLIALYEHKVFCQGIIWNINSFDQWGVELGKVQAGEIERQLHETSGSEADDDSSTTALLQHIRSSVKSDI